MSRSIIFILLCTLCAAPLIHAQEDSCSPLVPRLVIGEKARVISEFGNNLRAEPDRSGAMLGPLANSIEIDVLDGPTCAEGYTWWRVKLNDVTGWTVEADDDSYALVPIFHSSGEDGEMNYQGVHFAYAGELTPTGIRANVRRSISLSPELILWSGIPEHLGFTFDMNAGKPAELIIFPAAAYQQTNPFSHDEIEWLQILLQRHPDLSAFYQLPYLPPRNAAEYIVSKAEYLTFPGGSGIRFITHFSQGYAQIKSSNVTYVFQGLTDDGAYYVSFTMPISASELPAEDDPALTDSFVQQEYTNYPDYLRDIQAQVNVMPPEAFTPRVETLDAVIESLRIDPDTLADSLQDPKRFGEFEENFPLWTVGACDTPELRSRLSVGSVAEVTEDAAFPSLDFSPDGDVSRGYAQIGDQLTVLDGPVCTGNRNYWLVYVPNQQFAAWMSETNVKEGQAVYDLAPTTQRVDVSTLFSRTPRGQAMSDCSFIAYQTTVAYTEPNPNLPRAGLLIDGANYYVDALLDKPSGGFLWWRLTPSATIRNEGLKKIDQPIWVRVRDTGATSEECQHIPVIAQEK